MKLQHRLPSLTPEAVYFVALFSRFEFAAKRSGWLQDRKAVLVDWVKVAGAFGQKFYDTVSIKEDAQYLFDNPPKQLLRSGPRGVVFNQAALDRLPTPEGLFKAVATVRNNLAHGEKAHWDERDQRLVASATFILEEAVDFSEVTEMGFAALLDYAPVGLH